MQLSTIIPILFIFISNVCASPLYIGSSNNHTIQAISTSKHVTGKPGYRSYEYVGGYGVGNIVTPAIIKGIWITGVTTGIKEEEIIHEGAYLWKEGMLFAFLINDRPSRDLPDYIFIIKNVGSDLVSEAQTRLTKEGAKRFRDTTKAELMSDYNPKPKFLPRESWMYSKKNGMKAVFV